jgi:hypothetical protein
MLYPGSVSEHFSIPDPRSRSGSEHFFIPDPTYKDGGNIKTTGTFFMLLMVSGAGLHSKIDN